MSRRVAAALATLHFLALGCSPGGDRDSPFEERRSIVLIVIDTLRADHLSLHGYHLPTSPGLDRLGETSVVFDHCLASCSWTKPSTATILTGLDPTRHGAHGMRGVSDEAVLLAEKLAERGFRTAAFSGNPYVSEQFGMAQGFDTFRESGVNAPRDYPDVQVLLDEARAWLAEASAEPYFLYLHVMNVHGPYRAPREYRDRFLDGPEGGDLPFQGELWTAVSGPGRRERPEVPAADLADLVAQYDGAIAYTDECLTRFLDEMRGTGALDDAVLVVTSDHGEELMDHGGLGHRRTLYGEVVNVPLIIHDGANAGRIATPVGLVDVAATILELAAGEEEPFGDGLSLVPLMEGAPPPARIVPLMAHLQEGPSGTARLVQDWPWRRLDIRREYTGRSRLAELYDVTTDPGELHDRSGEEPETLDRLRAIEEAALAALEGRALDAGADVAADDELRERLNALGYTGN